MDLHSAVRVEWVMVKKKLKIKCKKGDFIG